jgi:hypothetical protein
MPPLRHRGIEPSTRTGRSLIQSSRIIHRAGQLLTERRDGGILLSFKGAFGVSGALTQCR